MNEHNSSLIDLEMVDKSIVRLLPKLKNKAREILLL